MRAIASRRVRCARDGARSRTPPLQGATECLGRWSGGGALALHIGYLHGAPPARRVCSLFWSVAQRNPPEGSAGAVSDRAGEVRETAFAHSIFVTRDSSLTPAHAASLNDGVITA